MNKLILLLVSVFFTSIQSLFTQELDVAKVTLLRKNVQVTINGETNTPKIDDELPLNAKVKSDGMGFLEFEYKGTVYRVEKNTTILLSEVIKAGGNKNFKPTNTTDPAGVRGADVNRKKNKKQKPKKKVEEDN